MKKRTDIGNGTIMVVDDNPANVDLLNKMLSMQGYKIRPLTNSRFGLQSALSNPPDLVLLDIRMPDLDGFTFCRKLKENQELSDVPVIFISALQETEDKVKAFEAGGVDYITKPFQEAEVLARVETHVKLYQARKAIQEHQEHLEHLVDKRTEELTQANIQHQEAQKIAKLGHWELDLSNNQLTWSDESFRIFEIDKEEIRTNYDVFLDTIHPDDREFVVKAYNDSVKNRTIYDINHRLLFRDGRVKHVHEQCRTDFDQGGNPVRSLGTAQDITPLKKAEEEKKNIEAQLQQAQKMEAIGTLAGGIAHDFNNILSAILGYSELAQHNLEDVTKLSSFLNEVRTAGIRAKDLVQQILTFSRQAEKKTGPVQIHLIIKEAIKLLRASLPATIEIRHDIKSDSLIMGNPTQIHQIMMNLCTNAGHAMKEKGGVLEVDLENVELDSEFAARHPNLKPGAYMKLMVGDTGHGMSQEVMDRIFDPFYTTKEKGEGTGMGLSVVHGIVNSYGGIIVAYSEPGKGSTFKVFFPVIGKSLKPEARVEKPVPIGSERILFIDDEKAIVDINRQILESLGYDVTARTSSLEALELFKAQPDGFDLVITDMTMPNMTGIDLARELITAQPDIPIILCTGFSTRITEEITTNIGIRALISKPILTMQIAETIRKVLDEK